MNEASAQAPTSTSTQTPEPTFEQLDSSPFVDIYEIKLPQYPYDTFTWVRLRGGQSFVYRTQSSDWIVWQGTMGHYDAPYTVLPTLIDEAVRTSALTRVPPFGGS